MSFRGEFKVGSATVTKPDVVTMNGLIHVIDDSLAVSPFPIDEDISKQINDPARCSFEDFQAVVLPGVTGLSMNHYVDTKNETISFRLVYPGQGWVGVGFSSDGSMIGSTAIIGLPDSNEVKAYDLDGYLLTAITDAVDSGAFKLSDASVIQTTTSTTLEFTRSIHERDDLVATYDSNVRIIYAVGAMNRLSYHAARGSVELTLNTC